MKNPLLIAHRGDTTNHQENTLAAFKSAFEKGADGIEIDIHLNEGKIIVVHDFLFNKNNKYPYLIDVLKGFDRQGRIEIEIKEFDTAILTPLKKILDQFPQSDFELTSSEIPLLPEIKEMFPTLPLGIILHDFYFQEWMTQDIVLMKIIGWTRLSKATRVHISMKILNEFGDDKLVAEIHKAGFIVHSHIKKSPSQLDDLELLKSWKVDQCTFDDIEILDEIKA